MKVLELKKFRHDNGFAYVVQTKGLSSHQKLSTAVLLEDGVPLPGPANTVHNEIRNFGNGRYSFWYGKAYFSSSDNSDPRTNGRSYSVRYEEHEVYRYSMISFLSSRVLKLCLSVLRHPAMPAPFKKFLWEIGFGLDSVRRLGLLFPFWSLFYWFSFLYTVFLRRRN